MRALTPDLAIVVAVVRVEPEVRDSAVAEVENPFRSCWLHEVPD